MKKTCVVMAFILTTFIFTSCGLTQHDVSATNENQEVEEIHITNDSNVRSNYDVIVVDGSPEGISAAISASRNGMDTLLVCQDASLGGLYTLGELNFIDVPQDREGNILIEGIYKEFTDAVGGSGFDITIAKNTFYNMIKAEDNLTLRVNSVFKEPILEGQQITGVVVEEDEQQVSYYGKYVIDATPDGDVCAAAGVPYTYAGEDIGERDREMGVTLIYRLSDVDWDEVCEYLTANETSESAGSGGVNGNLAWGYGKQGYAYEATNDSLRTRGLNIARQVNGDVLINSLIIFDVDALDEKSRQDGIERGKQELPYIVEYLNETCPGFENAKLVGTAPQLYVRETRHISCEYMLTIDDVLENRNQPDAIAITNYPVDVQATKTQRYGTVVGFPDQYAIGYGSLIPLEIDNLMIVGRSAGYRSMAAGSARIVPTGMACGQAAGVAVSIANEKQITPRALLQDKESIARLQDLLVEQGVNLSHTQTIDEVMSHWAYSGLKVLRSIGVADKGGYDNDYGLDNEISGKRFSSLLNAIVKKTGLDSNPNVTASSEETITNGEMLSLLANEIALLENGVVSTSSVNFLQARGIITEQEFSYLQDQNATTTEAPIVMVMARTYEYLLTLPGAEKVIAADTLE